MITQRHEGEEDVTVITQDAVLQTFDKILNVLTLGVAGIAAISLAVAGILVMNVMLVSVTQRTGEIGLAEGTRCDIQRGSSSCFMVEAILLSLSGAVIGIGFGYLGANVLRHLYPTFPAYPPLWAVLAGFGTALVSGVIFGVMPARRAAQLDPIQALSQTIIMLLADSTRFAIQAITSHRMRSFLTLLGIAVGIAAVILLTSIGEGVHQFVLAEFTQFGTNVINIAPGKVKTGGQPPSGIPTTARLLTMEDAQSLKQLPHVTASSPMVWGNSEVESNGRLRRSTIYGVDADFTHVLSSNVQIGNFLPAEGAGSSRAFVVLGSKLRNELFGNENPLGARVRIGGLHFRVIGVMAPKGQFLGIDLDDTAFIPAQRAWSYTTVKA